MLLPDLLHALADLTATEPRPEAQATAAALRAGDDTDFPPQPLTSLAMGISRTSRLTGTHRIARLVGDAQFSGSSGKTAPPLRSSQPSFGP